MADDKELFARALRYHGGEHPGKVCVQSSKPLNGLDDLSLAYTPGVAAPVLEIKKDERASYDYTTRGNLVAVISNGTAVLGLGNCGAAASKPVMEGKGQLFKKYADIDVFDLEVDCSNPRQFVRIVRALEPTFGGINLEDIKAPECFYIESELQRRMSIPVFHDDQHGTAVVLGAALLNAMSLVGKQLPQIQVVFSGAGAAATACAQMLRALGVPREHITMCDEHGVLYAGRVPLQEHQLEWARYTKARTLAQAMVGADVFVGLSVGGVVSPEMVRSMAENPLVLAMANPFPEITYEEATSARPDVLMGTGRSDYPNQINNVLGFPAIFRGALDVRAKCINEAMKVAASRALAEVARWPHSRKGREGESALPIFGKTYLLPKPGEVRVVPWVATAVARAAMESGVARRRLDLEAYRLGLERRLGAGV